MPTQRPSGSTSPKVITGLAFLIAYIVSRVVFASVGFHYAVFSEPFSPSKLAFDMGVWLVVFGGAHYLLCRVLGGKPWRMW